MATRPGTGWPFRADEVVKLDGGDAVPADALAPGRQVSVFAARRMTVVRTAQTAAPPHP